MRTTGADLDARRDRLRIAIAVVAATSLVLSAVIGLQATIDGLRDWYDRYSSETTPVRERAAGERHRFDAAAWDELRGYLGLGDRYIVVTPKGAAEGWVDRGVVTRTYAAYRLLPAIQVIDAAEANAVVYIDAEPPPDAVCVDVARRHCVVRQA